MGTRSRCEACNEAISDSLSLRRVGLLESVILALVCLYGLSNSQTCSFCEYIANQVLSKGSNPDVILFLHDACRFLEVPYSTECTNFIDSHGKQILDWIESEDLGAVCDALSLCGKTIKYQVNDDTTCSVCKIVALVIENYVSQNKSVEEIEQLLDGFCDAIPDSDLATECVNIANAYTPALINWIIRNETPESACELIGLCSSFSKNHKVLY
jgi:hypothetical protein